jgi:hypothetical protein
MSIIHNLFLVFLATSLLITPINRNKSDARNLSHPANASLDKSADEAKKTVVKAINAMGGEAALRQVNHISYEGVGHTFISSIAVRTQGAQPIQYDSITQTMSLKEQAMRKSSRTRLSFRANEFISTLIVSGGAGAVESGGKINAAPIFQLYKAQDEFLMNPIAALLSALDSTDLKSSGRVMLHDVPHEVVILKRGDIPLKILINTRTWLPSAVEITRAYPSDIFSDMWGDITTRTIFSTWSYEPGGIYYPRQWATEINGEPAGQSSITALNLKEMPKADSFTIPSEIRVSFERSLALKPLDIARQNFTGTSLVVASGVTMLPGVERKYNSTIIRQNDGLIILEAPYSPTNSSLVIAEAARLFPGQKIKAVITTSQIWIHVGGIREYIARRIPIYALDSNTTLIARLARSPHAFHPDTLQRQPQKPIIKAVLSPMTIGSGESQVVLYPFRSEGGERMMAVYFPQIQILYASDLYNPKAFSQQLWAAHVSEIEELIKRERLNVKTVFGIHMPPEAWSNVATELRGVKESK